MTEQSENQAEQSRILISDLMLEEILATIALLIIIIAVTWGVLTRYITSTPASWSGEVASIAFAWAVFLGAAAAFRRSAHIAIDSFLFLVPKKMGYLFRVCSALITLITLLAVTYLAARFTYTSADVPTAVLRLPQAVLYSAAAVGFGFMTFRHIEASYLFFFKKVTK